MEENKVAQRVMQIVHDSYWETNGEKCEGVNDGICVRLTAAIIQSPDLRVTLVEPRWTASEDRCSGGYWWVFDGHRPHTKFVSAHARRYAEDYAQLMNSKEQK